MGQVRQPTYTDPKTGERRTSQIWWIRYYRNGKRYEESCGSEKKGDAIDLLKLREGDGVRGVPITPKVGRLRFEDAAKDLLNDYTTNGKKTRDDVECKLEKHLTPYFGDWRMTSISPTDVRAYVATRKAETVSVTRAHTIKRKDGTVRHVSERRRTIAGVSNGEINRELTILTRMFTLAVESGKLYATPHIPKLQERNVRTGFFEVEQFERVRAHLKPHLRNVAAVAYITGWRTQSEILPLEWRQVDFEAGEVRLDAGTTKNGEARVFPMTIELRKVFEDQRARADRLKREKGLIPRDVFTKQNGSRIGSFRKAWATACKTAGCPGRIVHDFRRTAVRNFVRAGIPEAVAMKMTGHKTRSVFDRYNIVSPGDLTEAARKLDAAAEEKGKKRESEAFTTNARAGARTENRSRIKSLPASARSSAG